MWQTVDIVPRLSLILSLGILGILGRHISKCLPHGATCFSKIFHLRFGTPLHFSFPNFPKIPKI
jgi:hypothetical protein